MLMLGRRPRSPAGASRGSRPPPSHCRRAAPSPHARHQLPARQNCLRWRTKRGSRLKAHAFEDPAELVQDALVALRKADTERLSSLLAPGLLQFGQAEQQVLIVGGRPVIEQGPLSRFTHVLDTGARRLLPGNLLRRCQVLSSLQVTGQRFVQRTAVTACTGEEGVLAWNCVRHSDAWWLLAVDRDPEADAPLPVAPHLRLAPEAVVLAQLAALQGGDVAAAARFHVYAGIPDGAGMSERATANMLQDDRFLLVLGHDEVELGASALPDQRTFVQEVAVARRAEGLLERGSAAAAAAAGGEAGEAPRAGQLLRQTFLWTLGLRDCGSWLVKTVEAVSVA